jgi:hypothetical protein
MPIVIESLRDTAGLNVSSLTRSVVSAGPLRGLLAVVHMFDSGGVSPTVDTLTYAGLPLTLEGTAVIAGSMRTEVYSLVDPPPGSNDLICTLSAAVAELALSCISFSGVDPTDMFEPTSGVVGTDTTPTIDVLATDDAERIFDALSINAIAATPGAGQIQQTDAMPASSLYLTSTKLGSGGDINMSWSTGSAVDWAIVAGRIKPGLGLDGTLSPYGATVSHGDNRE